MRPRMIRDCAFATRGKSMTSLGYHCSDVICVRYLLAGNELVRPRREVLRLAQRLVQAEEGLLPLAPKTRREEVGCNSRLIKRFCFQLDCVSVSQYVFI